MKKIRIVGIASVILVVGIVALDFNNNRIEHINDQLATNPPAAGDGRTFGDIERARSRINDTTAGFHTKPASLSVYKEIEGNVTSFSDIPTRNYSASTGRGEIIQVNTSNPPTKPKTDANQQVKHSKWESKYAMFPQDLDGWSIITPSVDSRMIYVSSSDGNDSKAKAYFSKDIPDPHNPPSSVVAFKTVGEALKLQRALYPDWVLLKKGDVWQLDSPISLPTGRSNIAPTVLTSYGSSTKRPLIKTGVEDGINLSWSRSFIAVIGLEFYANQRDPNSSDFVGWPNVKTPMGFGSLTSKLEDGESIMLEDNVFRFFSGGIGVASLGDKHQKNIIIRRNQVLNSYSSSGHSQGLYMAEAETVLIEENLFDHNGWYKQNFEAPNWTREGQATVFNHNAYLVNMENIDISNNIFSRSSSIGLKLTANPDKKSGKNHIKAKNITVDNNLFIEGEIGISAGGNTNFYNGYRWSNISITNNVMMHIGNSEPTRRGLGWGIEALDWDGGVIKGNYLLCNINPEVKNILGVKIEGFSRNISVMDNVLFGLKDEREKTIYKQEDKNKIDVLFKNNLVSNHTSCDSLTYSDQSVIDAFIVKAKKQSAASWHSEYTAVNFNESVKASLTK